MDDYGLELSGLDPDTTAELRRLKRQQMMADELAKRGMTPLQGQMVGGVYVRPSVFQGLAGLANSWAAKGEQDRIDEGYKSLGEKRKAVEAAQLENYRKGTMGSPEIPIPEDGMGPGRPAMPATPEQRRQAIMEAIVSNNPRLSKMATLDIQQDWRKEDRAAAAQQRMAELAMKIEDARLSREERLAAQKELVKMQIEGRRDIATLAAGLRQEPAPTVTEIVKDGKVVKIDARSGKVIGDSPTVGKGKAMSATAQKELIQTDEEVQGGQQATQALRQALAINDEAMGFAGAGIVSSAGTLLPEGIRPKAIDATQNLDNILQSSALPQLKAVFGGMPTEGERKVLLEVQGSSSKSPAVRKEIFNRAIKAAEKRIEFSQKKAKSLREGTYFSEDQANSAPAKTEPSLDDILNKYK